MSRPINELRNASKGEDGKLLLAAWLRWAARSRLEPFVKLARSIRRHLVAIHNMLDGAADVRSGDISQAGTWLSAYLVAPGGCEITLFRHL